MASRTEASKRKIKRRMRKREMLRNYEKTIKARRRP